MITKRSFLSLIAGTALGAAIGIAPLAPVAAADLETLRLDFAYYNPVSLLIKQKGWVEEEFAKDGTTVEWVQSAGSNKALEYLNGGSIDVGSTAGGAALIGRSNGIPIKAVYVFSKPEWASLVTLPDSGITQVADLKGKTVAVTRGTDPHIFLLRALNDAGLTEQDVNVVLLQHADGAAALVSGQVDAWAGLDPHTARIQVENGAVLFYRNTDYNSYGVLNVREAFASEHPDAVKRLLQVYEKGRLYAIEHPDELQAVLVAEAKIAPEVAAIQLGERTDLSNSTIGEAQRATWLATGQLLQQIGVIKPEVDVAATVEALVDTSYAPAVVTQ